MENSTGGDITLNTDIDMATIQNCLERNDTATAKNLLQELLNKNPENLQAAFVMAQICEVEGDYKKAAEYYGLVFTSDIPPEFEARVLNVYEMADKYDSLYNIYKSKYEKSPNNTDLCERLANTCAILGKTDEAIELYNAIVAIQPDNIVALRQLIDIYENSNSMMFHLSNAKMCKIEQNFDKAEKEYKKAFTLAEKDEDILQIRYQMAKLYKMLGKNEQALDEYIYILSANEENFKIFLECAEIYIELNNVPSAINTLKRALDIYPDNIEAMQNLADIYMENGDFEKAENYYEKLVEADKNNIENKVNLAKVYLHLDKLDKTKTMLLDAEKINQNSTEVLVAMAGFYTYTSEFDKAKSYCTRIIQKLPNSPLGYKKMAQYYAAQNDEHLSHFNFGIYHELREEVEDAVNEYNLALQYQKDDYEIIRRLAYIHENMNELDFAADYYHTLFEAKVNYVEVAKKLGEIYITQKDYEMARRYIEKAFEETKDVELTFEYAKCMYKLKDFDTALEKLEYYKENTKSLENQEETEKLIDEIRGKREKSLNPFAKLFSFLD